MLRIFSFILFALVASTAQANSDWVESENIRARIVDDAGTFGVEIEPKPQWHFYYKEAGDAGQPTTFDFKGSSGFQLQEVIYPEYKVIDEYGFKTNAYDGLTLFPIKAKIQEGAQVKLTIEGAVCAEICIPFELKFDYKPEAPTAPGNELSLYIIGLALLAGLILNIMPCVLPVLSLKVLSVLNQHGKGTGHARINFLAAAAGIIVSFLVLAGIAIGLRNAGMAAGWGLHFQSPIFVGVLLVITLLFGFSLLGFFHMKPPSWLGGKGEHKDSLWGNFMSGVLATLLGTSCTAPVLVTAVSYALTGSTLDIIIIFMLMGIGMAAPFLLLALRPSLVKILPKPGKWMEKVKHFMGVLLLLTAAWLGYVLYSQTAAEAMEKFGWKKFDQAEITQMVAENKTVFVDITAQWCVNCKANKLAVIDTDEIQAFFKEHDVVLVQGDMTKPAPELLAYIKSFGRYGIPVNVVYGPNARDGILLDALLSKDAVKEAVERAK